MFVCAAAGLFFAWRLVSVAVSAQCVIAGRITRLIVSLQEYYETCIRDLALVYNYFITQFGNHLHHCAAIVSGGWANASHAASTSTYLTLFSASWYLSSSRVVRLSTLSPVFL